MDWKMNKDRVSQIINEVYDKYLTKYVGYDDVPSKELFLFEIKNNTEFSEKWGLKIEERELSLQERIRMGQFEFMEAVTDTRCDEQNIPTKLITLTYKNETVECYE